MRDQVQAALRDYDLALDSADLELAEGERRELLDRFPRAGWPRLELGDYAIGQNDSSDTYCRWMEFKAVHLGSIKGGSAAKLIIYKRKDTADWHYDRSAFDRLEDAWQVVRGEFVAAMSFAENDDWAAIEELGALKSGQALLAKTLHVYFPADVLPITSRDHLRHFLALLDRADPSQASLGAVALNRWLLGELRELDERGLTTNQLERFLYRYFQPKSSAQWLKISPGRSAAFWDECRDGGFVCVGWDDIGDLREFGSKEEFTAAFAAAYGSEYNEQPHVIAKKANELWRLTSLRREDRVVANRGKSQILAVGTVKEPVYRFDPDRERYRHLIDVDWDESYAKEIPQQGGWLNTIDRVTAKQRQLIAGAGAPSGAAAEEAPAAGVEVDPLYHELAGALESKSQVVLYGPPGTGKTFHARRFGAWWLRQRSGVADAAAVLEDDQSLRDAESDAAADGVLTFISFHPSYSYEDFVEGYRPQIDEDGVAGLRLVDGIFKRVCRAAADDPETTYLLIVDEINRANVAKVLGELITLIEHDKRGLTVALSQSGEPFSVPANLFVLGTMNTADRSVTLLDVALRRRFAFVELMPDPELVEQAVGPLRLADFLAGLNREVAAVAGREKQIGHAFLMPGGEVVADPVDFARVFRMEILPLLQEYCYEEYGQLEQILGAKIVDVESQALNAELLGDPEALVEALATQFTASAADSGTPT